MGRRRVIDYEGLKAVNVVEHFPWTDREIMLYALSVGAGRDPMNEAELPFVFEGRDLRVLPTFPVVHPRFKFLFEYGIQFERMLHGETRLTLHRTLPPTGEIRLESKVLEVYDKGRTGALFCVESRGYLTDTNELAYTLLTNTLGTADGNFGGPKGGPERQRVPERKPDHVATFTTREDQALLYRLNGDRNPLHADFRIANQMGFPRAIIHGLCSYGVAGWVFLRDFAGLDPSRVTNMDARFTSPLYPGERVEYDLWQDGNVFAFRARAAERDVIAIDDGRFVLKP